MRTSTKLHLLARPLGTSAEFLATGKSAQANDREDLNFSGPSLESYSREIFRAAYSLEVAEGRPIRNVYEAAELLRSTRRGREELDNLEIPFSLLAKPPPSLEDLQGECAAADRNVAAERIFVPLLESRASMGAGVPLSDHVNVLENVSANLPQLRRLVSFSSPTNLRLLTGYGDSMSPTFNDGDILLIDVGVSDLKLDAVYVLERHEQLFVKRIQRSARGGYRMISDNTVYPPEDIDPERDGFKVLARVVCVWNMRKL